MCFKYRCHGCDRGGLTQYSLLLCRDYLPLLLPLPSLLMHSVARRRSTDSLAPCHFSARLLPLSLAPVTFFPLPYPPLSPLGGRGFSSGEGRFSGFSFPCQSRWFCLAHFNPPIKNTPRRTGTVCVKAIMCSVGTPPGNSSIGALSRLSLCHIDFISTGPGCPLDKQGRAECRWCQLLCYIIAQRKSWC